MSRCIQPVNNAMGQISQPRRLVLIVDDEPRIGRILGLKLRLSGYAVISATSGTEALELISTQKPDIMLLDIVMPGMSGFEVLEEIRASSAMPVIVVTVRSENIAKAIALGANDVIIKPFDPDRVLEKINKALSSNE